MGGIYTVLAWMSIAKHQAEHIPGISTLGISITSLLIKVSATVSNRAAPTVLMFRWTANKRRWALHLREGRVATGREAS